MKDENYYMRRAMKWVDAAIRVSPSDPSSPLVGAAQCGAPFERALKAGGALDTFLDFVRLASKLRGRNLDGQISYTFCSSRKRWIHTDRWRRL